MKLHDETTTDPGGCETPFWELVPWYVNESLQEDEQAAFEKHLKGCAACQAEIARQRVLAKQVATVDPFEAPRAQSWEVMRAQIEADSRARRPHKKSWRDLIGGKTGLVTGLATATMACLVLVVSLDQPREDGFQTLTSAPEAAGPMIKFQAAPNAEKAELVAALAAQGASLVSGPSAQGIYTASLPEGKDVQTAADLLMETPLILFAAPETE